MTKGVPDLLASLVDALAKAEATGDGACGAPGGGVDGVIVPATTLRALRDALRGRGPAAREGEQIEGEMQRVTGRRYNAKLEQLNAAGLRELRRFVRDAAEAVHTAQRKAREPWRR